ncbi:MAG: hypothetical protein ACJASV_002020 [Pseudorhodobacter sp.]
MAAKTLPFLASGSAIWRGDIWGKTRMELIISLIAGAIGGNGAGAVLKKLNQGPLLNSILGILGGGLGGQILGMLGAGGAVAGGGDLGSIIGAIASGGVGGGALLAVFGVARKAMGK